MITKLPDHLPAEGSFVTAALPSGETLVMRVPGRAVFEALLRVRDAVQAGRSPTYADAGTVTAWAMREDDAEILP